jgi:hypothetical protein
MDAIALLRSYFLIPDPNLRLSRTAARVTARRELRTSVSASCNEHKPAPTLAIVNPEPNQVRRLLQLQLQIFMISVNSRNGHSQVGDSLATSEPARRYI